MEAGMDPRGRSVIITGASSGIGAAAAHTFAAAGARLIISGRDHARLEAVAAATGAIAIAGDLTGPGAAAALVDAATGHYGRVDIIIANAGAGLAAPVLMTDASALQAILAINLTAPLALIQAAVPTMRRQQCGQCILVSSVVGWRALPWAGAYAASKAALDRMSEALRVELAGSGIAITLARPGTTATPFHQRRPGAGAERRERIPTGVAPAVVARALLRAARREPRVAYVGWRDRLLVLAALLAPGITDRTLAQRIRWQPDP
jgi:short-subunit dehydrogenase